MNKIIVQYDDSSEKIVGYLNGFTENGPRWIKNRRLAKTYNTLVEANVVLEGMNLLYSIDCDSLGIEDKK
jgi:hypothetical protein